MPEISRFYGIVITIDYADHHPPHFHARYGDARATFFIDGEPMAGAFPRRATELVRVWARLHRDELVADWELARHHRPLVPIAPLD